MPRPRTTVRREAGFTEGREFNIKIQQVNLPEGYEIDDDCVTEAWDQEFERRLEAFEHWLSKTFPWTGRVAVVGRMGGNLAIEDTDAPDTNGARAERTIQWAAIGEEVEKERREFKKLFESEDFWKAHVEDGCDKCSVSETEDDLPDGDKDEDDETVESEVTEELK